MEAIRCEDLSKHFGKVAALDGLNLSVEQGEAFTLALFIAQACLDAIEQTRRFRPTNSVQWGGGQLYQLGNQRPVARASHSSWVRCGADRRHLDRIQEEEL